MGFFIDRRVMQLLFAANRLFDTHYKNFAASGTQALPRYSNLRVTVSANQDLLVPDIFTSSALSDASGDIRRY